MKHFVYYPKINYNNKEVVNIMVRAKIRDAILKNGALFYKYRLSDGDRPDIISSKYYGNSQYTWAIFYANDIVNPLTDWFKDGKDFISFMKSKYPSLMYAQTTIHHYEYTDPNSGKTYEIDKNTFDNWTILNNAPNVQTRRTISEVTIYQYEERLNDAKRNIVVLDKGFVFSIDNELSNIFA